MKWSAFKKIFLTVVLAATVLFGRTGVGHAVVLTFDDIPGESQGQWGPIGTYNGFNFGATNALNRMDWIDTVGSSWNFGAHSGDFTMLNNYGGSAVITKSGGGTFTFSGLWIEGWSNYPISGYVTGTLSGATQFVTNFGVGNTFGHVNGSSAIIDRLVIDSPYNYFLVDDLALNASTGSPVPEPGTMVLLGLGFAGLAVYSKRRQQKE